MKAVMLYEIFLHMKLNVRSKELLVHYYIVPFIFLYPHEQCVYVHHARRPSHLDTVNDRLQCDHGRRYGIALPL